MTTTTHPYTNGWLSRGRSLHMSVYHNMLASVGSVAPRMAHQENRRDLAYYDTWTWLTPMVDCHIHAMISHQVSSPHHHHHTPNLEGQTTSTVSTILIVDYIHATMNPTCLSRRELMIHPWMHNDTTVGVILHNDDDWDIPPPLTTRTTIPLFHYEKKIIVYIITVMRGNDTTFRWTSASHLSSNMQS